MKMTKQFITEKLDKKSLAHIQSEEKVLKEIFMNGIPDKGGLVSKELFERLIEDAYYAGVGAHLYALTQL
jgi:hypothetical protein